MAETWKPVVGYEKFYEVSDAGRVRSLRFGRVRLLRLCVASNGYRMFGVSKHKKCSVHVAVLEAFVGPKPPGAWACHCDGDRLNNSPLNLRWDTPAANAQDTIRHGRTPRGERHVCARLTAEQAGEIKRLLPTQRATEIAKKFGVSAWSIYAIKWGRSWRHV